jgi:TPR repeat protein
MTTLPTRIRATVVEPKRMTSTSSFHSNSNTGGPPPAPPPHRQLPAPSNNIMINNSNNNSSSSTINVPYNGPQDNQYFEQSYYKNIQPHLQQQYQPQQYQSQQLQQPYPPQAQTQQQQPQQYHTIGETAEDGDYLPDSSLQMAILAGKRRFDRLQHSNQPDAEFPPVTVENLNNLREESKNSTDPRFQMYFARYLLDAVKHLKPNAQDPVRAKQLEDNLTAESIKIIKKLASHKIGYAEAQFFLGNCYGGGLYGLKPELDKAFSLYLQGSKSNHPECTYRVAVCYELGMGTKKDYRYAMQFYKKAANASDPSGMYKLGLILLNGLIGQSKNPREAISWFLRAAQIANEDHPQPLHELAIAYEKKENSIPSVIPDLNYSRELYSQAAQLAYAPSQFKLGLAYENGHLNCPIDPRRSIAWYSRAAEQNDPSAELALSGWYLTGAEGVLNQNDTEAYLWARKSADRGLAKAEYAVGYYTETGVGIITNLEEAKQWYTRAASHGDKKAAQRLQVLAQSQVTVKRRPTRDKNGKPNAKDSDCRIM